MLEELLVTSVGLLLLLALAVAVEVVETIEVEAVVTIEEEVEVMEVIEEIGVVGITIMKVGEVVVAGVGLMVGMVKVEVMWVRPRKK